MYYLVEGARVFHSDEIKRTAVLRLALRQKNMFRLPHNVCDGGVIQAQTGPDDTCVEMQSLYRALRAGGLALRSRQGFAEKGTAGHERPSTQRPRGARPLPPSTHINR